MTGAIDGAYDTPKGRKVFVRQRPGESSDDFVERAMEMFSWAGDPFADDQGEARSDDLTD